MTSEPLTEERTGYCLDCGNELPVSTRTRSTRCLECHGRRLGREALDEYLDFDRAVLAAYATTKVAVLAQKWGLTRAAVYHRISEAKRRDKARSELT